MAEFYAGCATAEEILLARDAPMFFCCLVAASLRMDSAAAGGSADALASSKSNRCEYERCGYNRWVKAKALTLETVKSQDI